MTSQATEKKEQQAAVGDSAGSADLKAPTPSLAASSGELTYVIVCEEACPEKDKGVTGISESEKGKKMIVAPFEGKAISVDKEFIQTVSEFEAKCARLPQRMNANYLAPWIADKFREDMAFTPQDSLGSIFTKLAPDHIDAGAAEIVWRLLPGTGFLVVPALTPAVAAASYKETYDPLMPKPSEGATGNMLKFTQKCEKGLHTLIPIYANGHWTLLYIKRELPSKASSSSDPSSTTTTFLNPPGSFVGNEIRRDRERQQFQTDWPDYSGAKVVEVAYFESLKVEVLSCLKVAQACASLLRMKGWDIPEDLPRPNYVFQTDDKTCGLWVLQNIEEIARRVLGQRPHSFPFIFEERRLLVNKFAEKIASKTLSKK